MWRTILNTISNNWHLLGLPLSLLNLVGAGFIWWTQDSQWAGFACGIGLASTIHYAEKICDAAIRYCDQQLADFEER